MSFVRKAVLLAFALAACLCAGADDDSVILWFLNEPEVDDAHGGTLGVGDLFLATDDGRKGVNAARVSVNEWVSGADGVRRLSNVNYLPLLDAETGVSLSTFYSLPDADKDWIAGPAHASISGYTSDPSYVFMIELGNLSGDEWLVMAVSEAWTLEELHRGGYVWSKPLGYHGKLEWSGGSYVVPEPSSGLLLLVGAGLLSLRRRRRARAS